MSDHVLKNGEVLNGGYTVQIGDFSLRNIGGYEPVWEKVYDTENSFKDWQGNMQKPLLGLQFSLKISAGALDVEDYNSLVTELNKERVMVSCPDFEGMCRCENAPGSLAKANFTGVRYKASFTLIAEDLINAGGGL